MTSNQIFEQLGVENSDDAFKARILDRITATADLRFARVVDDIMTEEERQEFAEFSEGKSPEVIAAWVEEKYEGIGRLYDAIIEDIVADLRRKTPKGES